MRKATSHPSPFELERYVAADLAAERRAFIDQHIQECSACGEQHARLAADIVDFQQEIPFSRFSARHRELVEKRRHRRWGRWQALLPAGAAAAALGAALFFVLAPTPQTDMPTAGLPEIRLKGAGVALFYRVQEPDGTLRPGRSGETLPPQSVLQLSYDAGDNTYMAVLGLDSTGTVSIYYPEEGQTLGRVPAGAEGQLPFSLTLDAQGGDERFFAVFARGPAPLAPLKEAVQALGGRAIAQATLLQLPVDMRQSSFWVRRP